MWFYLKPPGLYVFSFGKGPKSCLLTSEKNTYWCLYSWWLMVDLFYKCSFLNALIIFHHSWPLFLAKILWTRLNWKLAADMKRCAHRFTYKRTINGTRVMLLCRNMSPVAMMRLCHGFSLASEQQESCEEEKNVLPNEIKGTQIAIPVSQTHENHILVWNIKCWKMLHTSTMHTSIYLK